VHSADSGKTWSAPQTVLTAAGAFTKNQLLRCSKGSEWLLPMYYTPDGFFEHHSQYSSVQRSADGGVSWHDSAPMAGTKGQLVQPTGGGLLGFFRSRAADYVHMSRSADDGRTWSHAEATVLPSNNSGIQASVLQSGALAIVFNNRQGKGARWPLSVALSLDEGKTWPHCRDLEPLAADSNPPQGGDAAAQGRKGQGEYSYPSIVQSEDGTIHISYTYRRETIKYVRISEDWIRRGSTVGWYKGQPTAPGA